MVGWAPSVVLLGRLVEQPVNSPKWAGLKLRPPPNPLRASSGCPPAARAAQSPSRPQAWTQCRSARPAAHAQAPRSQCRAKRHAAPPPATARPGAVPARGSFRSERRPPLTVFFLWALIAFTLSPARAGLAGVPPIPARAIHARLHMATSIPAVELGGFEPRPPGCDPRRRPGSLLHQIGCFAGGFCKLIGLQSSDHRAKICVDMRRCDPSRELLARSSRNRAGRFKMTDLLGAIPILRRAVGRSKTQSRLGRRRRARAA
jgi:hypothetical protein